MKDNIKNETERFVGKVKEKAGMLMEDNELEFKGKIQTVKADMNDKTDDMKSKLYGKANDMMDKWGKGKNS